MLIVFNIKMLYTWVEGKMIKNK